MGQPVAITREVSPSIAACELTHLERVPIDVERARAQHTLYIRALADAGYRVLNLAPDAEHPDSVFVEDVAVVLPQLAIITRPGAESRRAEVPALVKALAPYREPKFIMPPGTLDGGDVLVAGTRLFIGRSSRTTLEAIHQVRRMLVPHGYYVCDVQVGDCLHLKSAVTAIDAGVLLLNPAWVDRGLFRDYEVVDVDPSEPWAANALRLRDRVIVAAAFPRTAARLRARGLHVVEVDVSELAKAEGAVTCCSVIVES